MTANNLYQRPVDFGFAPESRVIDGLTVDAEPMRASASPAAATIFDTVAPLAPRVGTRTRRRRATYTRAHRHAVIFYSIASLIGATGVVGLIAFFVNL